MLPLPAVVRRNWSFWRRSQSFTRIASSLTKSSFRILPSGLDWIYTFTRRLRTFLQLPSGLSGKIQGVRLETQGMLGMSSQEACVFGSSLALQYHLYFGAGSR